MTPQKKFVYAYELHFLGKIQKSYTPLEAEKLFSIYHIRFVKNPNRGSMTIRGLIDLYTSFEIIHHIPNDLQ